MLIYLKDKTELTKRSTFSWATVASNMASKTKHKTVQA